LPGGISIGSLVFLEASSNTFVNNTIFNVDNDFSVTGTAVVSGANYLAAVSSTSTIEGTIKAPYLSIRTGTMTVATTGQITSNGVESAGQGIASTSGYNAGGGSYGGSGGSLTAGTTGIPYGSYIYPSLPGSRGGKSGSYAALGGLGGGVINITASSSFVITGTVAANGGVSQDGAAGGSGGSILIQTNSWTGTGSITSNGAAGSRLGSSTGGGGSGGRIAVHFTTSTFTGTFAAYGGAGGSTNAAGGPGTVFTKDYTTGFRTLIIGNNNNVIMQNDISTPSTTLGTIAWLVEPGVTNFVVDEVRLLKNAGLAIEPTGSAVGSNITLNIASVTGDFTGTLHVRDNQTALLTTIGPNIQASVYTYAKAVSYLPVVASLPDNNNMLKLTIYGSTPNIASITVGTATTVEIV